MGDLYLPSTTHILENIRVSKDIPKSKSLRDKRELTCIHRPNTLIANGQNITRGFLTRSHQNSHANDIIMSYDITDKQILVYKQGVVSQLQISKVTQTKQLVVNLVNFGMMVMMLALYSVFFFFCKILWVFLTLSYWVVHILKKMTLHVRIKLSAYRLSSFFTTGNLW